MKLARSISLKILHINHTKYYDESHWYQKHRPDIVFMDIEMSEYDGLYGLKKIKEYDPNATVVLVSGSVNVEEKFEEHGATAVLPKPFNMSKIKEMINSLCVH